MAKKSPRRPKDTENEFTKIFDIKKICGILILLLKG